MNLFNTRQFEEYSHRTYLSVKKNFQTNIEFQAQKVTNPIDQETQALYNIESPSGGLALYYDGQFTNLPTNILQVSNLRKMLENAYQSFTKQEKQELLAFLPQKEPATIDSILKGDEFKFGNPIDQFQKLLKTGYFTKIREKQQQFDDILRVRHLIKHSKDILQAAKKNKEQFKKGQTCWAPDLSQVSSLEELYPQEDFESASQQTQTEEMIEDQNEQFEVDVHQVFFKYEDKRKTQQQLITMNDDRGEYKTTKVVKPMLVQTKIVRSQDWVQVFRKQEEQRYKNPTKAYTYICEDGTRVTVAPVAKKVAAGVGKPRQHIMLKNQRPSIVTILTLVRDAAARLPNGVGTRADICELLKESQYVNEDIGDEKINTIVSGALDRLHYMTDACVKYDSEKKLWQYLHLERTGSVKDEDVNDQYKQKKPMKKKKVEEVEENE